MQLVIFLVLGASICAISHGCSHGTVTFMNRTTLSTSFGSLQSGAVVICINGQWSFVCSNKWSHTVAKVTCVDMGLSHYGAMAFPLIPSFSLDLPVSVSSISCRGDELSLLECSIKTIGKAPAGTAPTAEIGAVGFMGHDDSDDAIEVSSGSGSGSQPVTHCPGHAVAGIICQSKSNDDHSKCATGDLQLDTVTGRLEICINNRWGGVCHENWTSKETLIVHKQLAMDCPLEAVSVRSLPRGSESVFYKGFTCNGSEGNILECSNEIDSTLSSCGSTGTIVGLLCTELSLCNSNGSLRLISPNSSVAKNVTKSEREGIVQMCVDQAWKVVCASHWTSLEATTVCRQIGFSVKGARPMYAPFNTIPGEVSEVGKPIKCNGTEERLFDCLQQTSLSPSCENNLYAAVQCQEICNEGRVYIEKEIVSSNTIVFLYICIDEIMRVIHDTNWTLTDASIACKTAGFTKYGARPVSWISQNPGVPGLNAIHCTGEESTITNCSRGSLIVSNHSMTGAICHSSEDEKSIGIITNCTTGELRLVNVITGRHSAQSFDGVVQMCINGLWKPLCHNETTDNEAIGKVTCDQLGFGKQRVQPSKVIFHHNPGVHLNLNCNGSESSLLDCAQIVHLSKFRMLTCDFKTKVHCSAPPVQISSLTPKSVDMVISEGSYISPIKLTCSAIGNPPLVVRWNFLSTNLTVAYLRTFTNTVSGLNLTSVLTVSDPSPASNGEYECIVENSHGITKSRKSIVTIKVPPTIDVESEPFVEEGASAVMLCTGVGYPSPLLSLSKNGVRILTSSSSCHMTSNSVFPGVYKCTLSYSITNVRVSDAGSYTCEASTNGTFPVQYKSSYLSVWGAPKVVKKPDNTTIFLHPSESRVVANLTCIVKGLPLPVIDWYRIAEGTHKSLIEGNSEENRWRIITKSSLSESTVYSSLLISDVKSEDQGMYQCIGANSLGSVRTEASLYVHADHSAIIQALPSSVLLEGSKLTLLCSVYHQLSAKEGATFTWTKDDEPIKQEIPCKSVMTFRSISLSDSGQYQCIYRTSTGQTLKASINIRVEARLKIELKGDSPVVFGHKMWLMVESNKPTSGIHCSVGRLTKDCSSGEVTFDDLSCSIHDIEPYPLSLTVNATSALGEVSLIVRKFYMGKPTVCHYRPMLQACGDVCFLDCPYAAENFCEASADYFKEARQVLHFSFSGVASDFICYELTGSLKERATGTIADVIIYSPLLCSVHLINEGISVNGSRVMVEFTGMGPIKYYKCGLDSNIPRLCSSPLVLNNVSGGYHTLTIKPRGCYSRAEKPLSESFMIA